MPDNLTFEYLTENTKLIRPHAFELADGVNQARFAVLTEDPDTINLCHIFEGWIFTKEIQTPSPEQLEKAIELMFEGFGEDAWKHRESIENRIKSLKMRWIGIGKANGQHHTCRLPLQNVVDNVLKSHGTMIVTTDHVQWPIGLIIAAIQQIKP